MPFFTQRQLAERWQVSTRTIERLRTPRGELRWIRIGGSVRFTQEHVEEFEKAAAACGHGADMARATDRRFIPEGTTPQTLLAASRRGAEAGRRLKERDATRLAGLPDLPRRGRTVKT